MKFMLNSEIMLLHLEGAALEGSGDVRALHDVSA